MRRGQPAVPKNNRDIKWFALTAEYFSTLDATDANQKAASEALLPAQIVVDCLQSLPFNASRADQFIFEFSKYVQWQSTLEILPSRCCLSIDNPTSVPGVLTEYKIHRRSISPPQQIFSAACRRFATRSPQRATNPSSTLTWTCSSWSAPRMMGISPSRPAR